MHSQGRLGQSINALTPLQMHSQGRVGQTVNKHTSLPDALPAPRRSVG